jgi:hypothetical protein
VARAFAGLAAMDRSNGLHLSIKTWLAIGVGVGLAWGANALIEGGGMLGMIVGPVIVGLGAAAVVAIDRSVAQGKV